MRLFLSIALSDVLRERITLDRERIKKSCFTNEQLQRMRWIKDDALHITQYFIGEVPEERLDDVIEIGNQIVVPTKAFELESERYEFKPRQNPRMLWLRFKPDDSFAAIMQNLHNALVEEGLSDNTINDNPIPHVTLIRLKQVKPIESTLPEADGYKLDVDAMDLTQSFTRPTGSEYKLLKRLDLT